MTDRPRRRDLALPGTGRRRRRPLILAVVVVGFFLLLFVWTALQTLGGHTSKQGVAASSRTL
jgi:hypothetical protein